MKALKLALMKSASDLTVKKERPEKRRQSHGVKEGTTPQSSETAADQSQVHKSAYEDVINGNIAMLSAAGIQLQPLQFLMALDREDNLRKLIQASPLTKTLEDIRRALKGHNEAKEDVILSATGELVPMNISQLSPRQLVVYRFGSAVLHLVCQGCSHNPLLLLVAQTIPRVQSSVRGKEALRLDDSYHDPINNVIFIPATCLEHAGELAGLSDMDGLLSPGGLEFGTLMKSNDFMCDHGMGG
ncbi:uncharacterized protein [Hyperolius riggenbachi]|uniref:uncharacterized protein n=1 Tax=Hyperolius riggenbachi TaxID=752182 RepID=UPI0035A39A23